jgi:hypothetical protein
VPAIHAYDQIAHSTHFSRVEPESPHLVTDQHRLLFYHIRCSDVLVPLRVIESPNVWGTVTFPSAGRGALGIMPAGPPALQR